MTRDNNGETDSMGNPNELALEPADVVRCRECGQLVRRVNKQHLVTTRCKWGSREAERHGDPRPNHPESVPEYREKYPDAPIYSPREKETLAMKNRRPEVDERRRKLVQRRHNGHRMSNIVRDLAEEYGVGEQRIYDDWRDREKWLARVFGMNDAYTALLEAIAERKLNREDMKRLAVRAENQGDLSVAATARKNVDKSIKDDTDIIPKLIDRVKGNKKEVHVSGSIDHRHHSPGADLSEEHLRTLDAFAGTGEEEEIIDLPVTENGEGE